MRSILKFAVGASLALSMSLQAWAAPNWKTLTDAPHDTNGARSYKIRPWYVPLSDGAVVIGQPNDEWTVNHMGQMGADIELYSDRLESRLGIWAGASLKGKNPRALVTDWVNNINNLTGGNWTSPKSIYVAGQPVVYAEGVDAFGNYHYGVYSWSRFGVNYGMALRTPYENRWNTDLDRDISYFITWSHISTDALHKMGYK